MEQGGDGGWWRWRSVEVDVGVEVEVEGGAQFQAFDIHTSNSTKTCAVGSKWFKSDTLRTPRNGL